MSDVDNSYRIMEMYIASAKSYVQLSSGALVLTVVFQRQVLGLGEGIGIPRTGWLTATWVCFLAAMLFSAIYQYFAVRYLESKLNTEINHQFDWPPWFIRNPWLWYGLMFLSFYVGAVVFCIALTRVI